MYDAGKSAAALEQVLLWLEPDGYIPSLYGDGQIGAEIRPLSTAGT